MKPKEKDFICFYRPSLDHTTRYEAERGDAEAQAALGRLYFEGRSARSSDTEYEHTIIGSYTPAFEQNQAQAVKWLLKAARQGHAVAKQLVETIVAKGGGIH